jgi:septal ring factor EnvC (AmiA/AmiB activator)
MTATTHLAPNGAAIPHPRAAVPAASTFRDRIVLGIRRAVVAAGVAICIVGAALTTQAAAQWTALSAPLAPSVSQSELATQLANEQARAAALDAQVASLTAQSAQLAQALQTAQTQLGTDGKTAAGLRAKLKAAQTKLAAVQKALKVAAAQAAAAAAAASRSAAAPNPTSPPRDGGGVGDD